MARIWMVLLACSALALFDAKTGLCEDVLFLVTELPGYELFYDSYVLPLSEPDDIAYARGLIEYGPGSEGYEATIVGAWIAAGADGINRDYLAPGAPEWSWHVSAFVRFAEYSAEIYDGSPSGVESDLEGWIGPGGGIIGFWSYTVTAEIPEPATLGLLLIGGLALSTRSRLSLLKNRRRTLS